MIRLPAALLVFPIAAFTPLLSPTGSSARLAAPGRVAPPKAMMDKIETRIRSEACIGSPQRWERRYSYRAWTTGTVFHLDDTVIKFEYYEAGKFDFREGRTFYIDPPVPVMDDRSYRIAIGYYDMMNDRVTILACGENVG